MATGLENLKIYNIAEQLEIDLHHITNKFPTDERFRSVDQLKRSSASVSNNIAESYHRYSYQEKIHFIVIAKSEAEETKRNIIRSAKKNFLNNELSEKIADQYTELLKALSGYINFLNKQKINQNTK